MHYVGDLSHKKDERARPPRLKLQPVVERGSGSPAPLSENSPRTPVTRGPRCQGALLTYSQLATAKINDSNHQYAWFPLLSCAAALVTTAFTLHARLSLHKLLKLSWQPALPSASTLSLIDINTIVFLSYKTVFSSCI